MTTTILLLWSVTSLCAFLFAQNSAPAITGQSTSIPTLYWGDKPDLDKWLVENEAALNKGDGCDLTVAWSDEDSSYGSAAHEIADFVMDPDGEPLTRDFRDTASGSNLEVRVGVRYERGTLPSTLYHLEIALALEGSPDGAFDQVSRSEARTVRSRSWTSVSVVKEFVVDHRHYFFELGCQNGRTYMSFLRHPSKKIRRH